MPRRERDCICASLRITALTVLEKILCFNADRKRKLVRLKLQRMDANAFAFFRGTDHLFAESWSELRPADAGPNVLICGDLHLENFGAYRSEDGDFRFDVNDFDEAVVAPCSLDLVRCATSILLAAELWRLTPLQAAGMVLAFLDQYRLAVDAAARTGVLGEMAPGGGRGSVCELLGATMLGSQEELLEQHTTVNKKGERRIRRSEEKHPAVRSERVRLAGEAVESYGKTKEDPKVYRVLDVTGRVAGIGSLGLRRYTVLVRGLKKGLDRLLDIKEAHPSAVAVYGERDPSSMEFDDARRIVEAQRHLQGKPIAGLGCLQMGGRSFRIREMVPDENRSSLERLRKRPDKLRGAVEFAGRLAAWSHMRGARFHSWDRTSDLVRWATGAALDAVLTSSVRYAERTYRDFLEYHSKYAAGRFDSPSKE